MDEPGSADPRFDFAGEHDAQVHRLAPCAEDRLTLGGLGHLQMTHPFTRTIGHILESTHHHQLRERPELLGGECRQQWTLTYTGKVKHKRRQLVRQAGHELELLFRGLLLDALGHESGARRSEHPHQPYADLC